MDGRVIKKSRKRSKQSKSLAWKLLLEFLVWECCDLIYAAKWLRL